MAESRLVPSNLMAWPRVRDLLPDQKLIIYHLWATCHEACGCGLVDLPAWQGHLSITFSALEGALEEFERRGLVKMDQATGEVMILDWLRFHKFNTGIRQRLLVQSIEKIQSETLKSEILLKSNAYISREDKLSKVKNIARARPGQAVDKVEKNEKKERNLKVQLHGLTTMRDVLKKNHRSSFF